MKLFFEEITGQPESYTISESDWFTAEEAGRLMEVDAHLLVSRYDHETIIVKGQLAAKRETVCDRCGEPLESELHCEFVYRATTRREETRDLQEVEFSDEEAITLYLEEPVIDVDDILREQAYLAVPLRTLCRDDCKGICAGCGAQLNVEPCRCTPDTGDSPFSVLGKLRKP